MKRVVVITVSFGLLVSLAPDALAWRAAGGVYRGGGAAVRGPAGGGAVRGPYGGAAVRGPAGNVAVRGPYGGAAVRAAPTVYGGVYRAPAYGAAAGLAVGAAVGAAA